MPVYGDKDSVESNQADGNDSHRDSDSLLVQMISNTDTAIRKAGVGTGGGAAIVYQRLFGEHVKVYKREYSTVLPEQTTQP